MLLSKACVYAIQAASYLARQKKQEYVSIHRIAKDLNISYPFLTKILQVLTQNNITTSHRGPIGGVALGRASDKIHLIEIITAIEGKTIFRECILGLPDCGSDKPCILHDEWKLIRSQLENTFQQTTLSNIARRLKDGNIRLSDLKKGC